MDSSHLRVGVHTPPLGNTAHCFYNTIPCYAILGCRRFVIHFTGRSGRGGWGSGSWKAGTSFGEMCNRGLVWKRCNEGFRFLINVIVILFLYVPWSVFQDTSIGKLLFQDRRSLVCEMGLCDGFPCAIITCTLYRSQWLPVVYLDRFHELHFERVFMSHRSCR